MSFYTYLEKEHNYTEYQIKLVRYAAISLLSEFTKLIIMGIIFSVLSLLKEYLFCIFIFSFLRFYSGGLHCGSYVSCLSLTFIYLCSCILILPFCNLSKFTLLLMMLFSIIIIYKIAPIPSRYHAPLSTKQYFHYKMRLLKFCFLYLIILFILPFNHYLYCGSWVIIIHAIQLLAAYTKEVILCHFSSEI